MRLYQVVGNVLKVEPETLSDESNAETVANWDSLRHIEVIFAVESAFHTRFTMPEIAGLRNLGDIQRLLVNKGVDMGTDEPLQEAV